MPLNLQLFEDAEKSAVVKQILVKYIYVVVNNEVIRRMGKDILIIIPGR
jgi:hypothetical protein